jgi:pimeloyl-ACP methyl ester carboxylesterase
LDLEDGVRPILTFVWTSILAAALAAGSAAAAAGCDNFFGQRCRVPLSTGVHMSYFEIGPRSGETLIFLHTDTTSALDWAWTAQALARLDPTLRLITLDQRGAGSSELPATEECWSRPNLCMTRGKLAADVLAFMDARGIAKATLVGHAMGASVARRIALEHPERVTRLILSGVGIAAPKEPPAAAGPAAAPRRPPPYGDMRLLGWQQMVEAKGVRWPEGALHMRPLDIDPDAVRNIAEHWDISAVAPAAVVQAIAAQTALESLATWERLDSTPVPAEPRDPFERLSVPVLSLWGSEDAGLDRASQERLIAKLREAVAAHPGMTFHWKQYGVRPPPPSGDKHQADDIGHNLSWEAPAELAADVDRYVRTGAPTADLYHTDFPRDIHRIVVEPGKANVVSSVSP